jgi:hypothetical protein
VRFRDHAGARLLDFRCPFDCPVEPAAVLRDLRLAAYERAS